MRINWVASQRYQVDPAIDLDQLKGIGPIWGSWQTWRACGTDNVVCYNLDKARDLIERGFHNGCNFYIHSDHFTKIGRPQNVKMFGGSFDIPVADNIEDIIALHLAASNSDILLLLGFDFTPLVKPDDKFESHKLQNYRGMVHAAVKNNPDIQWVLIDHPKDLDKVYQSFDNITCDTLANALKLSL